MVITSGNHLHRLVNLIRFSTVLTTRRPLRHFQKQETKLLPLVISLTTGLRTVRVVPSNVSMSFMPTMARLVFLPANVWMENLFYQKLLRF